MHENHSGGGERRGQHESERTDEHAAQKLDAERERGRQRDGALLHEWRDQIGLAELDAEVQQRDVERKGRADREREERRWQPR